MSSLTLVTPPAAEPLTAAEAKARLGIGSEVTDATIEALIKSARLSIEKRLQMSLITQTWRLSLNGFSACPVKLPRPPVIAITSVKYVDSDGTLQTLAADQYEKMEANSEWYLQAAYNVSWPSARLHYGAVLIEYTAGFGSSGSSVPEDIRNAVALMVSHQRSMMERNLFVSSETADGVGSTSYVVGGNAGQAIEATLQALLGGYRVYA